MRFESPIPDPLNKQLYSFQSSMQSIGRLEFLLDDLRERFALSEKVFRSIWISLNEAVSNAILHGNKCDPYKKVLLSVELHDDDVISFRVKDEGSGFNPAIIPDPTTPERLLEPNGRGVYLMQQLADRLAFNANGSEVEMSFDLNDH